MSNEQKTPFVRTLPRLAERKAVEEIEKRGYALPGHVSSIDGSIVTVDFDVTGTLLPQVTMPVFGPEYIRYPIQVGDKGVAFPATLYIGGVSGLGQSATAAFGVLQGNLSSLVWFPCGNSNWSAVDADAVTIYGPNGVVFRDTNSGTVATLTPTGLDVTSDSGTLTFSAGGVTVTIDSTGVTIDGILFETHTHSGVTSGGDDTGPPVP